MLQITILPLVFHTFLDILTYCFLPYCFCQCFAAEEVLKYKLLWDTAGVRRNYLEQWNINYHKPLEESILCKNQDLDIYLYLDLDLCLMRRTKTYFLPSKYFILHFHVSACDCTCN